MARFIGQSGFKHDTQLKAGVLVTNLGTPDAPTPRALRRYLKQFLWDPRVVEVPRPIWWLILNGVILNLRPRKSAKAYSKVWTDDGSPLLVIAKQQKDAIATALRQKTGKSVPVELGMRYGNPSIPGAIEALAAQHVQRLLVLPLYPQYAGATTASTIDCVADVVKEYRWVPELRFVNQYHDQPAYIDALAASIREAWSRRPKSERLLMSFHGIPKRYLLQGDPYHCQCQKTARLLAQALGLTENEWAVSFQSRLGREEWLKPYTDITLQEWARSGTSTIDVVCPGFSADCLETLEEIAMENRDDFIAAGGKDLIYIPCLNERSDHIDFLADLALRNMSGWPEIEDPVEPAAQTGDAARQRARAMGALA